MPAIDTVGIISKPGVEQAYTLVPQVVEWLRRHNLRVRYDSTTATYLNAADGLPRDRVADGCQLLVVLGGDGTLLSAARAIRGRDVTVFPVNLGGLGFLTAITVDAVLPELERAVRGEHRIGHRRMIDCDLHRGGRLICSFQALNDVVLTKASMARMIDLEVWVDIHFVCKYRADGLIVSTPTGSTAYSLSAGGPIIFPTVAAFCITPICPHMLTNRPVIVPDESTVVIKSRAQSDTAYLTIDGQVGEPLEENDEITCRRSERALQLVRPPQMMFFDVLREKLSWGER